jgi:hypothetical protein
MRLADLARIITMAVRSMRTELLVQRASVKTSAAEVTTSNAELKAAVDRLTTAVTQLQTAFIENHRSVEHDLGMHGRKLADHESDINQLKRKAAM